jgi:hypothetical protein
MRHKRESAQRAAQARTHFARAQSRARIVGPEACAQVAPTVIRSRVDLREQADISEQADIMAGLRNLGFRADEARRAAEYSATLHDATLERRMRAALKTLGRRAALGAGRGLSPRDETRTPAY